MSADKRCCILLFLAALPALAVEPPAATQQQLSLRLKELYSDRIKLEQTTQRLRQEYELLRQLLDKSNRNMQQLEQRLQALQPP